MNPIIVTGCDRSGTTLLASILGNNENILTIPEAQFIVEIYKHNKKLKVSEYLEEIKKNFRFKIWEHALDEQFYDNLKNLDNYTNLIFEIINSYGRSQGKTSTHYFIDHSPVNLHYLETLQHLFPSIKIIHIIRDGRAIASSVLPLDWGPNSIEEAAKWWNRKIGTGFIAKNKFHSNMLDIKYEDLINDPEETLLSISKFLNIQFNKKTIASSESFLPAYTKKQHNLIGKGLNGKSVNKWKTKLSCRQIELFEYFSGEVLSYLNYNQYYLNNLSFPRKVELYEMRIKSFFKLILNRMKWKIRKRKYIKNEN